MVPLRGREVLLGPLAAGVHRHRATAIVRAHEVRRIGGVDPEVMVVAVRTVADARQRLPGVGRPEQRRVLRVHDVRVLMIGEQVRVVERALTDVPVAVHQRPRGTRIVALEQAAVVVLDQGIHTVRIRGRECHTNTTHQSRRQALVARDLGPRFATVDALEQAGTRTARRHLIFLAVRLPHGRVHHARVVAVEGDIDRARLVVAKQHLPPRLAAVGALEHATLGAGHAVLAEHRREHDVGVCRMDADLRDGIHRLEAHVRPRLAGVGALVDAVAGHDVTADRRLAHADVHDVGIALAHRDGANRRARDLPIGHRRPVLAAIGGLPESATGRAEVRLVPTAHDTAGRDRPATAIGADVPPPERLEQRGIERHGRQLGGANGRRRRLGRRLQERRRDGQRREKQERSKWQHGRE